jgi:hypothetical protein
MLIVGLLVLALALLVFGLVEASAPLLIASLVISVAAGVLVFRARAKQSRPAAHGLSVADGGTPADPEVTASEPVAIDRPVWVIDGRPRYHRQDCEILIGADSEQVLFSEAIEDGFIACSLCQPEIVRAEANGDASVD